MVSALVILKDPENTAMGFERRLPPICPQLSIRSVHDARAAWPHLGEADVLITLGPHLGTDAADVFGRATRLKWVQVIGTGVDNVHGHPALPRSVVVTNVTGVHGPQMSEAAFAGMLGFARDTGRILRNQMERRWERFASRLLAGKTVGILGLGAIAGALAPRCRAFGMHVVGFTATPRALPDFDAVHARTDLAAHAPALDYLVVLVPYSAQTRHIINADILGALRPDAVLVNLARGGVVDEDALLRSLREGGIRGAALDVFATEPLPPDSPFWDLPNVVVTPHLGGLHEGYADQVLETVADNLRRYVSGGTDALLNRA